ncbi:MAG TPA: MFS transporter [Syntrophales bacterium]|nr:MFS transporter [Syntrophales bacterium]HOD98002.1 MFS transporter [Syntrophales bacterium]HOH73420.1 MFS transporter [Syntrophales bacterium]HPN07841.1 MFS transporter [Syntrophales bacterium]HPX80882.1 MFS transporter [Syntrophales bacterium]
MNDANSPPRLLTYEFIVFCLITITTFCTVSIFYSFHHYLVEIGIPPSWRGLIIGIEPMTAFILRLVILPWLQVRDTPAIIAASTVAMIFIGFGYLCATTVASLIVLRIFHGAAIVFLTVAVTALGVNFIPPERSGQAFGIFLVVTIAPYAFIPPMAEAILPYLRNEADLYAGVSIFVFFALLLLARGWKRIASYIAGMDGALLRRPTRVELYDNFSIATVRKMLWCFSLVYLIHATLFFFLKDLTLEITVGRVGTFFSIFMTMTIAVRLAGSRYFDRVNKKKLLLAGFAAMATCFAVLPTAGSPGLYYLLAGLYGLGMGVIMPVMNALLFAASPPALRGINVNMTMFTLDLGYFIMPYLGGLLIALGMGFSILFYAGAGFAVLAAAIVGTVKTPGD